MQLYETASGKLFYCIYTLHKRQLISLERKSKLKGLQFQFTLDLLIRYDDRMNTLLKNISSYNEQQVLEHLLTIVDQYQESNPDFECLDDNNSVKSTHTQQKIIKPNKLLIERSTFKLKQPGCLSTRSSKRTSTLKIS